MIKVASGNDCHIAIENVTFPTWWILPVMYTFTGRSPSSSNEQNHLCFPLTGRFPIKKKNCPIKKIGKPKLSDEIGVFPLRKLSCFELVTVGAMFNTYVLRPLLPSPSCPQEQAPQPNIVSHLADLAWQI